MRPALLVLMVLHAGPLPSPDVVLRVADRPVLTLDEAVKNALATQPTLRQAQATTEASFARADEARAPLLPQVTLNGTYLRTTGNFAARPGSIPTNLSTGGSDGGIVSTGPNFNTFNYFQFGATASQLIWDFNQTLGRWNAAKESAQSSKLTEEATRLLIVLNARVAYFTARAQKDLVKVADESLANQTKHRIQIEGFVEVGTRAQIDLAQARTDEANARVQLITSENNYETAKAQLNQAMGMERTTDYDVGDETVPPFAEEENNTEQLLDESLKARPEFAATEAQIRSQNFTIDSVRGGYFPTLGVSTGLTDNGPSLDRLVWNWSAQVQAQWTIFGGLITPAQVREQHANLSALEAQRDSLRLQVRLEVDQARLALRGAKASLVAAEEALTNARERLKLAEGRYQTGVGSIIELGDAQVALTQAGAQRVTSQFNVAIARAQLLKAVGRI